MRRAAAASILALLLVAAACGPAVDPSKVAAVQVMGTDAALHGCRLLGTLEAKDTDRWVPGGPRYETAMLDLRKKAVMSGGSVLVTDSIEPPRDGDYTPTFTVRARLFACPAEGAPSAADHPPAVITAPLVQPAAEPPKPAPAPVCEPDCSPGYTCLRGVCVSACNPLCARGERCGADRICHPVAAAPVAP